MNEGQVPGSALTPHQVAARLQGQVAHGITWARRRKAKFRKSASAIRMVSLVLAVSSTIILGLQQLNFWTGLAFSFVAVGTLVGAVEPFFNWRSRWILMEEAQYKLQRIRDELEYYLLKTPTAGVILDDLDPFLRAPARRLDRHQRALAGLPAWRPDGIRMIWPNYGSRSSPDPVAA